MMADQPKPWDLLRERSEVATRKSDETRRRTGDQNSTTAAVQEIEAAVFLIGAALVEATVQNTRARRG